MTATRYEADYIKKKSGELTKLLQEVITKKKSASATNEALKKLTDFLTTSNNLAAILGYRKPSGNGQNDFQIMCSLLMNIAPAELNTILMKHLSEKELATLFMASSIDSSILLSLIYVCGAPFFDKISKFLLNLENRAVIHLIIQYHLLLNCEHDKKKNSDDKNTCPVLPKESYACLLTACSATQLYELLGNSDEDFPLFWKHSSDQTKNQVIAKIVGLDTSLSDYAYILLLKKILIKLNNPLMNDNSILKISVAIINERIAKFHFDRSQKGEKSEKETAIAIWCRLSAGHCNNNLFIANVFLDEVKIFKEKERVFEESAKIFAEEAKAFGKKSKAFTDEAKVFGEEAATFGNKAKKFTEQAKAFKEEASKNASPIDLYYLACDHLYHAYKRKPENLPLAILADINIFDKNAAYENHRFLFLMLTYLHVIYLQIAELRTYNGSLKTTLPGFFALLDILECFINKMKNLLTTLDSKREDRTQPLMPKNDVLNYLTIFTDKENSQLSETAHETQREILGLEKKENFDNIALLSPPLKEISRHTSHCYKMLHTFFGSPVPSKTNPLLTQAKLLKNHLKYLFTSCQDKSSRLDITSQPTVLISQRRTW